MTLLQGACPLRVIRLRCRAFHKAVFQILYITGRDPDASTSQVLSMLKQPSPCSIKKTALETLQPSCAEELLSVLCYLAVPAFRRRLLPATQCDGVSVPLNPNNTVPSAAFFSDILKGGGTKINPTLPCSAAYPLAQIEISRWFVSTYQ